MSVSPRALPPAQENRFVLLLELKSVLLRAQSSLLNSNLEEIYASTARQKAILRALQENRNTEEKQSPSSKTAKIQNVNLQREMEGLQSQILTAGLLYCALLKCKQRTADLLSRTLANSTLTYSLQGLRP